jgi:proteasome lid subunit RPN8/RPN11
MVEFTPPSEPQPQWGWNDLQRNDPLETRSLETFLGDAPPVPAPHAGFVLVLPERLRAQMIEHAGRWVVHEQAGILLGRAWRDPRGFVFTVIAAALPVEEAEATIAQVKMRAAAWPSVWRELQQNPGQQIIGWYHSHPGYGIFLSATDRTTQNAYFSAPWQVAVVVDPVRGQLGVFAGTDADPLPQSTILSIT